jgi:hypothetical protein
LAKITGYDVLYSTRWGAPSRRMTIEIPRGASVDSVHWFLVSQIARARGINKGDVVVLEWSPVHA